MTKNGRTIREKLLALLRMPDYRPSDRNEIARALRLQGRDRVEVRKTLRELEHAGEIVRIRKNRGIFITSCQTIRDWCTMFMFKFRRAQSCRKHRGVTTKSLFVWKRGNRATSIPKAKSSKSLEPQLRPESTCCRSSGNMICPLSFQRVFSMKRIEFRKQSNKNSSKSAKICAINSSSRSIRMTRATLTTRSTLKRSTIRAVGGSAFTSQLFPLT